MAERTIEQCSRGTCIVGCNCPTCCDLDIEAMERDDTHEENGETDGKI